MAAALAVAAILLPASAGGGEVPSRVVSMNVCTDQLAMLIAAPGQLVSISYLAADPRLSAMAEDALRYHLNHGDAEDLFLLHPDVVLADEWSDAATVGMLRRLGIRVEQFNPGQSMDDIRGNITRMGEVLGQPERARKVLDAFDTRIASVPQPPEVRPRAALYGPNGWTEGPASLAGQILDLAGFANVASELGYGIGGTLPLDTLVMSNPDVVIAGEREVGAARSDEVLVHPALKPFRNKAAASDASWVCPGPAVADAVLALAATRTGGEP
jgi:iron complex transport system substrate-binding protein